MTDLDVSTGNLATVAGNQTTAIDRIEQLEQEVVEFPKARAELEAAREWVKERAAIVARVQGELAELKTRQVEAAALLTVVRGELATRTRQRDQVQDELKGAKTLPDGRAGGGAHPVPEYMLYNRGRSYCPQA